ncbi:hypothetical protein BAMA_09240 [Bacillus manliponensis]|uniref:Uncharacterized protein n=1 Tax=Bacillus manliponensis TaxID=574376 RepID=A0A073K116_9BACI|nr:hypothetical protein BAMA_09240 [Bacillus manliponensis]
MVVKVLGLLRTVRLSFLPLIILPPIMNIHVLEQTKKERKSNMLKRLKKKLKACWNDIVQTKKTA